MEGSEIVIKILDSLLLGEHTRKYLIRQQEKHRNTNDGQCLLPRPQLNLGV